MIGYNSHGKWAPLKRIIEIEKEERFNNFPSLELNVNDYEAIWVCLIKKDTLRYCSEEDIKTINLNDAHSIHQDNDGGTLWIRIRKL